jgi:hypothetical protein
VLEGRTFGSWSALVEASIEALGLDRLPRADHSYCPHRRLTMLPASHRLALLIRTRLGREVSNARQWFERPDPVVSAFAASARGASISLVRGSFSAVVQQAGLATFSRAAIAYDGHVVLKGRAMTFDPESILALASEVDQELDIEADGTSDVTALIQHLKAGAIALDVAASAIAAVLVARPTEAAPMTAEDQSPAEMESPEAAFHPNTFDDVGRAHIRHEITDEQYSAISKACSNLST